MSVPNVIVWGIACLVFLVSSLTYLEYRFARDDVREQNHRDIHSWVHDTLTIPVVNEVHDRGEEDDMIVVEARVIEPPVVVDELGEWRPSEHDQEEASIIVDVLLQGSWTTIRPGQWALAGVAG